MKKLLALAALFLASPALSATYYVDCAASNDSAAGTAPNTAWRTIEKVNKTSFKPGDSILFQRGCTWREQLTVPSSGAVGKPITFGAYGGGALPVITGANNITAEAWAQFGERIYYTTTLSADPTVVWLDGASYPEAASATAVNATNRWFWGAGDGRLYLYAISDPSGFYHDIEAPVRKTAVVSIGKAYITYENLELRYGSDTTMLLLNETPSVGSNNAIIQDCTITGSGYKGALRIKGTSNNCTVQRCTIVGGNRAGVDSVMISDDDSTTSGTIMQYCVIKNGAHSTLKLLNAASSIIQYNLIKNDNDQFGRCLEVENALGVGGNIVRYNWIEGAYVANGKAADGNKFFGDGNELYYNVITTGDDVGVGMQSHSESGLEWVCINNKVFNNVIYGFAKAGLKLIANLRSPAGNLIKNNIVFGNGVDGHQQIEFAPDVTPGAWTLTNNDIYDPTTTFTVYDGRAARTLAYLQTNDATHWLNNLVADPGIVDAAHGNFGLNEDSPCVDAGENLGAAYAVGLVPGSAWPSEVLTGEQSVAGRWWEIGAFVVPADDAGPAAHKSFPRRKLARPGL